MMVLNRWLSMIGLAWGLGYSAWAQEERDLAKGQPAGGFGLWTQHQEDSVQAVFARKKHLTRMFGNFYRLPDHRWVLVHYRFGIPEGEQYIFTYTECPPLDRATFRELEGSYWQDKRGVYYAALTNFSNQIIPVPQADLASFRSLGFEHLAVDRYRVYQNGQVMPGLVPATLRLYTPNGILEENWDFNRSAYLVSGSVVYTAEGERLTAAQTRRFRLPAGYRLAYPVPVRRATRGKSGRTSPAVKKS